MGKYELTGVIIGNVVFWVLYLVLEEKTGWQIPISIRILVVFSILSNGLIGVVLNLYHTTAYFDNVQHAVTSYAVSIWAYYLLQQFAGVVITSKKLHFVIIVCLALSIGASYEIFEFSLDHIIKTKNKNQFSLYDTDLDLIANLIGGVIAAIHFVLSKRLNSFLITKKGHEIS